MAELGWLTYDDFGDRVGEQFEVATADGALLIELIEVTGSDVAGGTGPDGVQRAQFSLVFRGPADPVLSQGTVALTHAAMGELVLFLVPLGSDATGMRYEAAFA
jgi:hypothetical protein